MNNNQPASSKETNGIETPASRRRKIALKKEFLRKKRSQLAAQPINMNNYSRDPVIPTAIAIAVRTTTQNPSVGTVQNLTSDTWRAAGQVHPFDKLGTCM